MDPLFISKKSPELDQLECAMTTTRLRAIVRVDQQGRLLVPKEMRDAIDMPVGGNVTLLVEDGELRVITPGSLMNRLREQRATYNVEGRSLVDEFLAERRSEAERE
jgi:bifunctional DNA-binding transcriptional regulator/antitoxin component of YhaV-PrlF toxin-antitoxin module